MSKVYPSIDRNTMGLRGVILCMVAACVVLMQVTFTYINTLPINLGTICIILALPALLFASRLQIKKLYVWILLSFLSYTAIIGLITAISYIEFAKSFAQICLFGASVLIAASLPLTYVDFKRASQIFILLLAVVAVLIIAQGIVWNVGNSSALAAPLGQLSPMGPGGKMPYKPFSAAIYKRPNGIYSEPSIAGWMMCFGFAMVTILARYRLTQAKFGLCLRWLFAAAATVTGSVTAIIGVITIIATTAFFTGSRGRNSHRGKFSAIFILLVCGILIPLTFGNVLINRLKNSFDPGTSIYFRVVAPTKLLSDSLVDHPLGHAVGDVAYIKSKSSYMVDWVGGSQTDIDNSALLICYYYGFVGVGLVLALIVKVGRVVIRGGGSRELIIAMTVAALATGALWSAWFSLFLFLGLYMLRQFVGIEHSEYQKIRLVEK